MRCHFLYVFRGDETALTGGEQIRLGSRIAVVQLQHACIHAHADEEQYPWLDITAPGDIYPMRAKAGDTVDAVIKALKEWI